MCNQVVCWNGVNDISKYRVIIGLEYTVSIHIMIEGMYRRCDQSDNAARLNSSFGMGGRELVAVV